MCHETEGLCCDSIFDFQLFCLALSKATDTPEDRNNPVLLYNKMELGDLNANFTLEVESQVKILSASVRICFFFSILPLLRGVCCFRCRLLCHSSNVRTGNTKKFFTPLKVLSFLLEKDYINTRYNGRQQVCNIQKSLNIHGYCICTPSKFTITINTTMSKTKSRKCHSVLSEGSCSSGKVTSMQKIKY